MSLQKSKIEKLLITSIFITYAVGYFAYKHYPFYNYELFATAPRGLYIYTFLDKNQRFISPNILSFGDFTDGPSLEIAGRKPKSFYLWNKKFEKEDFKMIFDNTYKNHKMDKITVIRSYYTTNQKGVLVAENDTVWTIEK